MDQNFGEHRNKSLYLGTDHTPDHGTLRICRTTDCPVDFTSSMRCRRCGEKTEPDAYRVSE